MEELRLAFIGFGSANRALARMLLEKSESPDADSHQRYLRINSNNGSSDDGSTRLVPWRVVCILTRRHGRVACMGLPDVNHSEVDLEMALRCVESGGTLDRHSILEKEDFLPNLVEYNIADTHTDTERTLQLITDLGENETSNIVVEAIPTNPFDGEPVISFISQALKSGLHVVSANKSPLAHCNNNGEETYWQLQQLAASNDVMYKHESSVMDGVPIFSFWQYTLPNAKLSSVRGCLNSTTTQILTRMEGNLDEGGSSGESFEEALSSARQMGIVEEDESLDLDGYDAAVKLRALLVVLSSSSCSSAQESNVRIPTMNEIHQDSIRNVTGEDIRNAYANGRRKYRLVSEAKLVDVAEEGIANDSTTTIEWEELAAKKWEASVRLQLLPPSDPLYNLSGTDASVQFCTDVLGPVTVVSSNPTLVDTAYGLFSDIVRVASEANR